MFRLLKRKKDNNENNRKQNKTSRQTYLPGKHGRKIWRDTESNEGNNNKDI
jgi:hypothetical protein